LNVIALDRSKVEVNGNRMPFGDVANPAEGADSGGNDDGR